MWYLKVHSYRVLSTGEVHFIAFASKCLHVPNLGLDWTIYDNVDIAP